MKHKRLGRTIIGICLIISLFSNAFSIYAHEEKDHNEELRAVLFGDKNWKPAAGNVEAEQAIQALEYASYLAIDFFNSKSDGQKKLNTLRDLKVFGLPSSISTIDYSSNNYHRRFTHRGWDFIYSPVPQSLSTKYNDGRKDVANWAVRKDILLATVNKVFVFGPFFNKWTGYANKCNSMAALIYYVHIIGDNESDKTYKNREGNVMDLAYPNDTGIIDELIVHCGILFEDQNNTRVYKNLMSDLKTLNTEVKSLVSQTGGLNNDEKFNKYKEYVDELLNDILVPNIPLLLKNEAFFTEVFR